MGLIRKILLAVVYTVREHRAPRWASEPVRAIANRVAGISLFLGVLAASGTQALGILPAEYRDEASAAIGVVSVVAAIGAKWAGEVARSKVFAPDTVAVIESRNLRSSDADVLPTDTGVLS